jgi:hypothetical protein
MATHPGSASNLINREKYPDLAELLRTGWVALALWTTVLELFGGVLALGCGGRCPHPCYSTGMATYPASRTVYCDRSWRQGRPATREPTPF